LAVICAGTVSEYQHVKTLNPYSRMALAVRGWGLEVVTALGLVVAWELGVALGGEGLSTLLFGTLGIALWRFPLFWHRVARTVHERATRRWFNRVLVACEVISRRGSIPRVETMELIPAGQRLKLRLPPGQTADFVAEAGESLAAAIGAREVRVVRDPASASIAHLSIIWRDPLAFPAPAWTIPAGSLWEPISLGIDEDGNPVSIGLPERNLLLGGEPGAGKSAALSIFIAAAALDSSVHLTLMDGKQVELAPWSGSAEHFVGPDMAAAIEVLKDLCAEMDRRYAMLLGSGLRKIAPDGEFGLHVVAIDELAFYMRGGKRDERNELTETLRDLISRGRAAGIIVIAATQKPSNEIIPTFVRDLFSFRMALRCTTPEASDTILGQGWASQGYSASTLDPTTRGVGFLLAEGAAPRKIRTHYLSDDDIAALAKRAEGLRGATPKGRT
jgi:DNA segregation ATPase FtsK/SpoIIIE-like protein